MPRDVAASPEEHLFRLYAARRYDAALEQLHLMARSVPAGTMGTDEGHLPEFSLPLPLSLRAYKAWSIRLEALRSAGLGCFLESATKSTPAYAGVSISRRSSKPLLASFPLIDRLHIAQNYADFLSRDFAAEPFKFIKPTTGTTGDPLTVWFDLAAFYDISYASLGLVADSLSNLADAITSQDLVAVFISDHPLSWSAQTTIPALRLGRMERRLFIEETPSAAELVRRLRLRPPPLLCGKGSTLLRLAAADWQQQNGTRRIRPCTIFVSGETLFDDWRELLEGWFQCPVISAYTSAEGGLIAMECRFKTGLHVCSERAVLEVLEESGHTSGAGSGELVLTNLMNWAMPFIRYQTRDQGRIVHSSCPCGYQGQTITSMYGREATFFAPGGVRINPRELDGVFRRLGIVEFTVREHGPESYEVRWSPLGLGATSKVSESDIRRRVRAVLGPVSVAVRRSCQLTQPGAKAVRYVVEHGGRATGESI